MHSSASEAKDSLMFWSKVPGQAPLPQLKVAQQREVSHTFFKLAQQYSALQEEECLHVQPINTPLEYCRHVTHDVFWLKGEKAFRNVETLFSQSSPSEYTLSNSTSNIIYNLIQQLQHHPTDLSVSTFTTSCTPC